jgi:hypothetical protein
MSQHDQDFNSHEIHKTLPELQKTLNEINQSVVPKDHVAYLARTKKLTESVQHLIHAADRDLILESVLNSVKEKLDKALDFINAYNNQYPQSKDINCLKDASERVVEACLLSAPLTLASYPINSEAHLSSLNTYKLQAEKLLTTTSDQVEKFDGFYKKTFENTTNPSTGNEELSFENNLEKLKGEVETLKGDYEEKYKALYDKIDGLVEGATTAGLAVAFNKFNGKSFCTKLIYQVVFYGLLLVMSRFSYSFVQALNQLGDLKFENILLHLLQNLPLWAVGTWLGFNLNKRANEAARLEQEYAHKTAVTQSYQGFKEQIDKLTDNDPELHKDLKSKHIQVAIDAIGYNPSQILDNKHGELPPFLALLHKSPELRSKLEKQSTDKILKD